MGLLKKHGKNGVNIGFSSLVFFFPVAFSALLHPHLPMSC